MKGHKTIQILKKDKINFQEIKNKEGYTFSKQLEVIFNYFASIKTDKLISIIIENYSDFAKDEITTLTINKKYFYNENYFNSICKAIKSKYPNLNLKKMYLIMIHYYLKQLKD